MANLSPLIHGVNAQMNINDVASTPPGHNTSSATSSPSSSFLSNGNSNSERNGLCDGDNSVTTKPSPNRNSRRSATSSMTLVQPENHTPTLHNAANVSKNWRQSRQSNICHSNGVVTSSVVENGRGDCDSSPATIHPDVISPPMSISHNLLRSNRVSSPVQRNDSQSEPLLRVHRSGRSVSTVQNYGVMNINNNDFPRRLGSRPNCVSINLSEEFSNSYQGRDPAHPLRLTSPLDYSTFGENMTVRRMASLRSRLIGDSEHDKMWLWLWVFQIAFVCIFIIIVIIIMYFNDAL